MVQHLGSFGDGPRISDPNIRPVTRMTTGVSELAGAGAPWAAVAMGRSLGPLTLIRRDRRRAPTCRTRSDTPAVPAGGGGDTNHGLGCVALRENIFRWAQMSALCDVAWHRHSTRPSFGSFDLIPLGFSRN